MGEHGKRKVLAREIGGRAEGARLAFPSTIWVLYGMSDVGYVALFAVFASFLLLECQATLDVQALSLSRAVHSFLNTVRIPLPAALSTDYLGPPAPLAEQGQAG